MKYKVELLLNKEEKQIVRLLAKGFTLPQIAVETGKNLRTLETHVLTLRKSFKSNTLAGMVAIALRKKIIK